MSTSPPATRPALDVHASQRRIDRVWGVAVGATALVILVVVAAVSALAIAAGSALPLLVLLPFLVVETVQVAYLVGRWRALRAITVPLTIDEAGLVLRSAEGQVALPWEAVAGAAFGRYGFTRVLQVRLHPAVQPGDPRVPADLSPRAWRIARRHGLRYALWLLDLDQASLAAAIATASGGRVVVAGA